MAHRLGSQSSGKHKDVTNCESLIKRLSAFFVLKESDMLWCREILFIFEWSRLEKWQQGESGRFSLLLLVSLSTWAMKTLHITTQWAMCSPWKLQFFLINFFVNRIGLVGAQLEETQTFIYVPPLYSCKICDSALLLLLRKLPWNVSILEYNNLFRQI